MKDNQGFSVFEILFFFALTGLLSASISFPRLAKAELKRHALRIVKQIEICQLEAQLKHRRLALPLNAGNQMSKDNFGEFELCSAAKSLPIRTQKEPTQINVRSGAIQKTGDSNSYLIIYESGEVSPSHISLENSAKRSCSILVGRAGPKDPDCS